MQGKHDTTKTIRSPLLFVQILCTQRIDRLNYFTKSRKTPTELDGGAPCATYIIPYACQISAQGGACHIEFARQVGHVFVFLIRRLPFGDTGPRPSAPLGPNGLVHGGKMQNTKRETNRTQHRSGRDSDCKITVIERKGGEFANKPFCARNVGSAGIQRRRG